MRRFAKPIRKLLGYLRMLGIDPFRLVFTIRGLPPYVSNLRKMRASLKDSASLWPIAELRPCLSDRFEESGAASGHYFHQDLIVAQAVFAAQPRNHVDVGSRIDGLVAHIASFRPVEVLDIRQLTASIRNVSFRQHDLMGPVPQEMRGCCDSLSCLHALEHLGLGRYGDPVRANGHLLGLSGLHALLQPGGTLYLSVPMGPQRIEFDAHRVFSLQSLFDLVSAGFERTNFSYVDDRGDLHRSPSVSAADIEKNFGCRYGCAILELKKRPGADTVTFA